MGIYSILKPGLARTIAVIIVIYQDLELMMSRKQAGTIYALVTSV